MSRRTEKGNEAYAMGITLFERTAETRARSG